MTDERVVRDALEKILSSASFVRCPRMSRFLTFVVEETLSGRGTELKESLIGLRVFDKSASYDPITDSTVRVEAAKLRTRLARYYSAEGGADDLVIDIPKGAYIPRFDRKATAVIDSSQEPASDPVYELRSAPAAVAPESFRTSERMRPSARAWREIAAWCTAAAFAVLFLLSSTRAGAERNRSTTVKFEISPPDGSTLPPLHETGPAVLSADSSLLAFVAASDGERQLYLRRLDDLLPRPIAGTEGASFPFWSPDGKELGYFAAGSLLRINLDTGLISKIADAPDGRGGAWSTSGTVLYAPSSTGPLFMVPASGGAPRKATRLRQSEVSQQQPSFTGEGAGFLYVSISGDSRYAQLFHAKLDSAAEPVALAATSSAGRALGNVLVHARGDELVSQAFHTTLPALTGSPQPLARYVATDETVADFSVTSKMISRRTNGQNYWTIELTR